MIHNWELCQCWTRVTCAFFRQSLLHIVPAKGHLFDIMSRCFPFPPPGYEKKPKLDLEISVKKEKLKKEKKDDRSKKEKDKIKDKHKKKDHSDKRKDKEQIKNIRTDRVKQCFLDGKKAINKEKFPDIDNLTRDTNSGGRVTEKACHRIKESDENTAAGNRLNDKSAGGQMMGEEKAKSKVKNESRIQIDGKIVLQDQDQKMVVGKEKNSERQKVENSKEIIKNKVEDAMKTKDKDKNRIQKGGKGQSNDRDQDKQARKDKKSVEENYAANERGRDKKDCKKQRSDKGRQLDVNLQRLKCNHAHMDKDYDNFRHMEVEKNGDIATRKRKDIGCNGDIHDFDKKSSKLSRSTGIAPICENGSKEEEINHSLFPFEPLGKRGTTHGNIIDQNTDERHFRAYSNSRFHEFDGKSDNQVPSIPPLSCKSDTNDNGPLRDRPENKLQDPKYLLSEHNWQDSKYLPSFPVKEPWSDFDDQRWILDRSNSNDKPKVSLDIDKPVTGVWSEPVHIDTVDIYALPFVIPY